MSEDPPHTWLRNLAIKNVDQIIFQVYASPFKVPANPSNRRPSSDGASPSTSGITADSQPPKKIDKRQTLFGGGKDASYDEDADDADEDGDHSERSGGTSGEVMVNDSISETSADVRPSEV